MISLCIVLLVIVIKYQTANGFVDPAPIVFGEIGMNVTIQSRIKSILIFNIIWYHQRPGGKLERVASFNAYATQWKRYTGAFSKGSNYVNVNLTISNTKTDDSGRYFAVMLDYVTFKPGFTSILAITDPEKIPVLRVFRSHAGTFICELKGGGPRWSAPRWGIEDSDGRTNLSQPEAEGFLDEQGAFIQSSILSLDDGFRGLNCSSRHSTGLITSQRLTLYSDSECLWLWFVTPLCVLLLLVTVTATAGWLCARRLRMQTHTTQEMENNGGT